MPSDPGTDDTVRLVPMRPPLRPHGTWRWAAAGAATAALAMGIAGWLIWPRETPAPAPVPSRPVIFQPLPSQPAQAPFVATQPVPTQPASSLPASSQPPSSQPTRSLPAPSLAMPGPATEPARQFPAQPAAALPYPAAPVAAPFTIETADEAEIRADVPTALTVFRFAANPSIIVLDFASLREQGRMLNRIAALIEKGATPRDRVLNDTELDAVIRAGGDTVETFYYGHDYSAAAMARFFALAAQEGVRLDPEEEKLHRLLAQLGWLAPGVHGGLISLPKVGANTKVTAEARRVILRHELSHGEYFSNPAYAAYVHRFWLHDLTRAERAGIRKFLASEEYDSKVEELVENEMQAYLMFTRDPVFFTPAKVGMTRGRLAELQTEFQRNMPRGWLRDLLGQTLSMAAARTR